MQDYLSDAWLDSPDLAQLAPLPSVKTLSLDVDLAYSDELYPPAALWSQIVVCKIASTMPDLETLGMSGTDDKSKNGVDWKWYHARKYFRQSMCNCYLPSPSIPC